MKRHPGGAAVQVLALLCVTVAPAHAHHVMEYATPATALEGFLSGLGHPVIGVDHLLFVIGAGVLAARVERGFLLPFAFVIASTLAVCFRYLRPEEAPMSEFWVAGSLLALGVVMLLFSAPRRAMVAALFLLAGAIHGYALAEGIVGAEMTPLAAYLAGLTLVLCVIASSAWAAARSSFKARPAPLYRLTGVAIGIAGLLFTANAALG